MRTTSIFFQRGIRYRLRVSKAASKLFADPGLSFAQNSQSSVGIPVVVEAEDDSDIDR